jgi:hypothetical protein
MKFDHIYRTFTPEQLTAESARLAKKIAKTPRPLLAEKLAEVEQRLGKTPATSKGAPAAPEPTLLPEPPASETAATEEKSEVAAEPADDDEVPLIPGGTRKRR